MALPTSPSVVVIENDVSVYAPNVNSSVVGIVGFADKGPVDKPTLVTSQQNLLRIFGKPDTPMPGQGLEGALEILEATNQVYYVRAADTGTKANASGLVTLGACPSVQLSSTWDLTYPSSIYYSVTDNSGNFKISGTVNVPASSTASPTKQSVLYNVFDPAITGDQAVFAYVDASDNAFLASKYAGASASLLVEALTPAGALIEDTLFSVVDVSGNTNNEIVGVSGAGVTAPGYTSSSVQLVSESVYPGTGYNLSSLRDGSTQGVSVEVTSLSVEDRLSVNSEGSQVEQFQVVLSPSAANSVEFLLINDELNNQSDYVYADVRDGSGGAYLGIPEQFGEKLTVSAGFIGDQVADAETGRASPRFVKMIEGTYPLASGHSGYDTSAHIAALIGTATAKTGLYALDDDFLNISIATVPGIGDQSVQNALITLGETSKNFLALLAPPYAVGNTQDAVDWLNGKGTRTAAVNSSYAAAYWPWVQVFNSFAGAEEWYDPAIFAARQCVFTDSVSEPWFAPAGFRRGRLTKPSDTEVVLNQGDRNTLYSNSVNPITKEPQTGITIFGQKTTQRGN